MTWMEIGRSGMSAIHYDEPNRRLIVHWESSGYYVWGNVPPVEVANLRSAPNPSAYFRKHIEPHAVKLPARTGEEEIHLLRKDPPAS